jgi:transcription factor AP-1
MDGKMQPPAQQGGRKRQNLTLDLNSASSKKSRVQNLLTSPDVQMLKLTSPELEKFLNQNPTLATPTPSGYIFPKSVTEEQIMYAKGFEEALEHLRSAETTMPGHIVSLPAPPAVAEQPNPTNPILSTAANQAIVNSAVAAATNPVNVISAATTTTLASLRNVVPSQIVVPQLQTASSAFPPNSITVIPHPTPRASITIPDLPNEPISLPPSVLPSGPPSVLPSGPQSRPGSGASGSYDSESYQVPDGVKIKDEPSDDASISGGETSYSTGLSPIDMESQERIKLERKRLRNRLAATKCRKRKLERISHLDDRVKVLKNENGELVAVVKKLKASVAVLKQEVIEHVNNGCEILMNEEAAFSS